ncbi:MAG: hypothetical protein WCD39_05410 [Methyloceanibacter sp.]
MMLSECAAEVELTEGRVTPRAVNFKPPVPFIQAHKFGGVQSTARCTRDLLLRGSAVSYGQTQDYRHDNEDFGKDERQQLHERFPRRERIGRNF